MNKKRLLGWARKIFAIPTAPYAEHHMIRLIRDFCSQRKKLSLREDDYGNMIIRYSAKPKIRGTLFAFHAHLDHPGMRITRRLDDRRVEAEYLGGGPREGLAGARVRIFRTDKITDGVRARVETVRMVKPRGLKVVLALAGNKQERASVKPGQFTMFDFPPMQQKGDRLFTRACDDNAAVVALLAFLDELGRRRIPGECIVFFTRAEETGLEGAAIMAEEGSLPRRAKIIGLENSSALAGAVIGGGPVVRVGDRLSIFDARVSGFLTAICKGLPEFPFQRKLMDGGACETTVFCAAGYEAGAVCLPLGNYHNIGPKGSAKPEYISAGDLNGLVEMLVEIVRRRGDYLRVASQLKKAIRRWSTGSRSRLKKSRMT